MGIGSSEGDYHDSPFEMAVDRHTKGDSKADDTGVVQPPQQVINQDFSSLDTMPSGAPQEPAGAFKSVAPIIPSGAFSPASLGSVEDNVIPLNAQSAEGAQYEPPEMPAKEALKAWTDYGNRPPEELNRRPMSPQSAKELEDHVKDLGEGFFNLHDPAAQDYLKTPHPDVDIMKVPLEGVFPDTKYQENDRLLYVKKRPLVSMDDSSPDSVAKGQMTAEDKQTAHDWIGRGMKMLGIGGGAMDLLEEGVRNTTGKLFFPMERLGEYRKSSEYSGNKPEGNTTEETNALRGLKNTEDNIDKLRKDMGLEPGARVTKGMVNRTIFPQEEGVDAEINAHATGFGGRIQSGQGPGRAPAISRAPEVKLEERIGSGPKGWETTAPTGERSFILRGADGKRVGSTDVTASADGKEVHVDYIEGYGKGGPNAIGPRAMRDIIKQLKTHFPEMETITGWRVSGARTAPGSKGEGPIKLNVKNIEPDEIYKPPPSLTRGQ